MRTDHRYNLVEDKLFLERYFVYQNAPGGAPKPAEAAPTQPSAEPEKPPTLEDAKDKIKIVKDSIDAVKAKYPKAAERSDKFKALGKKLDEINKKIQDIEKAAAEKKQELTTTVNGELDVIIYEISAPTVAVPAKPATAPASAPAPAPATAPAAAPTPAPAPAPATAPTNAPTANPDKPSAAPNAPNKPSAAPESKDRVRETAERDLGKYLDEVAKNPDKFSELRGQMNRSIETILYKMNIDLKDVKAPQTIDLPGGYSMTIEKWDSNGDKMPNAIIYKGRDLVCYKDYGILKQARLGQIPNAAYKAAQIVKCFNKFPDSFRTIKSEGNKNDKFKITNEEDFALMGIEIARYSRQDKPWTARLDSCSISYDPADKLVRIAPKESAFEIVFNPNDPGKIGVIGEGASKIKWENISSYIETAEDKEARVKEENTEAEKHLKDTVKQKMEERKDSTRKVKEDKEKENKALHEKLEKSVDRRFLVKGKEIVKFDSSDPSKFKIESGNDKTAKSLIDGTKIDQLINLKGQPEAVKITIKDGSGEREGLYYPGQDTCYELKDGKQTDNRLKFHDGDTISVKFAKPSSAEHSQVRSADTGKVEKPGADWEGKYDEVFEPAEGISIMKKGGKFGFVDQTGKELASPKYELVYNFREGMAKVKFDGKFGFVDKTGKEVVPPKYDNVSGFKDGVARIRVGEKRGFIDKTGTEVIPPKYDKADLFENGKAKVKLNGKEFYIDKTGKETKNT